MVEPVSVLTSFQQEGRSTHGKAFRIVVVMIMILWKYEVNNKAFRNNKWAAPCPRDELETPQTNGKSELLANGIWKLDAEHDENKRKNKLSRETEKNECT